MYDVLIVGGGIAGLRAALAARSRGVSVGLVSKAHPTRSHSVTIQDGINAATGPGDSWETHAADAVTAGEGLNATDLVNAMCREAPELVMELDRMGVPFNRADGTELSRLQLRGSSQPRSAFADDMSGLTITQTLHEQALRAQVEFHIEWAAISLVVEEGACRGIVALELASGRLETFSSKAVVLATGAPRRLYEPSTASLLCTGDGLAMAYRAGVPLGDMEFVQYHPAVLQGTRLAVTELAWAHGGSLNESDGGTTLKVLWPPEQVKSEIFNTRYRIKQLTGVDIAKQEPIPVRPAMHRVLGGVSVDEDGATPMPGLYAAGGCAGTGLHGAAGLDGDFLLAGVFSGKRTGTAAGEHAGKATAVEPSDGTLEYERAVVKEALGREGDGSAGALRQELADLMHQSAGQARDKSGLARALKRIGAMKSQYAALAIATKSADYNFSLLQHLELGNMLDVAEVIVTSAQARTESRGVHVRSDHPSKDDDWAKHLTVSAGENGPEIVESAQVAF